ncbi:MAG: ATP-dependent 6-phosphofructokinase [Rhodospirillales bacterium]|nr:ATP-dependent 6-phosphofructokinase [Rhodospirillales bacterium]
MAAKLRLGILTSGGDCAGLNAAIRAVVCRAIRTYGWQVIGIRDGSLGLLNRPLDYEEFDLRLFSGSILRMGGTLLGTTNRGDPFSYPMPDGGKADKSQDFIEGYRQLGLDALVVIGGDGSMRIMHRLCRQGGIPMVGIPKTIDNDVAGTDAAIGFSTAVNVAVDALDRLQPTAASHHRIMILEVMGRDAGHIALHAGIAGGADVILLPEISYTLSGVVDKLGEVMAGGRNHALVVVAEGVRNAAGEKQSGIGHWLGGQVGPRFKAETRVTVLGHVQRGGVPSPRDRIVASAFGVRAVDMVAEGRFDRMVAWRGGELAEVPLDDVVGINRGIDPAGALVATARSLGIYLGETG